MNFIDENSDFEFDNIFDNIMAAFGKNQTDQSFSKEDVIVVTGTIIKHEIYDPGLDYVFDPADYIDFNYPDYDNIIAGINAVLEAHCADAQETIDKMKNDFGLEFNLSDEANSNQMVTSTLATLAHIVTNYGDVSISNSILDPSSGIGLQIANGNIPEASISIDQIFSNAGSINISLSGPGTTTFTTSYDTSTPDPNDLSITIPVDVLTSSMNELFPDLLWSSLIHELAHVYHLNDNLGPWEFDSNAGWEDGVFEDIEHNALARLTEALANAVSQTASENSDSTLDFSFESFNHCDLDFG